MLQAASVIGTDVPFDVLEAIAGVPRDELRRHLDRLQSAEFLYETALFPALEYTFKHALTHEVAYGSLLGDRRRALHARIVEAIERLYADRLSDQIERLAGHAVRGEILDKAVTYLHEAGAKALRRSANDEAVAYFTQALDLLTRWPDGPERERTGAAPAPVPRAGAPDDAGLRRARGRAHLHAGVRAGRGHRPAGRASSRRCGAAGSSPRRGAATYAGGRRIAEALIALGERLGDRALRLEAHHAMAPTTLWMGEPEAARRHCEQGIALYDQEQHRSLAFLYGGHDPGVCCRMHSALALWMLGYPALALERSRSGLALARELAHPGTIVNAFPFAVLVHQLVGDSATLGDLVESMVAMSTEYGLRQWLAYGRIFDELDPAPGRTAGRTPSTGSATRSTSIARWATILWVPAFQGLLADVCLKHGATAEGLATIARRARPGRRDRSPPLDAGIPSAQGELLLARDPAADAAGGEAAFREAIDGARSIRRSILGAARRDEPEPALASARASARRPAGCWRRSTAGSPRASTPPISEKRACSSTTSRPRASVPLLDLQRRRGSRSLSSSRLPVPPVGLR